MKKISPEIQHRQRKRGLLCARDILFRPISVQLCVVIVVQKCPGASLLVDTVYTRAGLRSTRPQN